MRKLQISATAVVLTLSSLAVAQQNKVFTPFGSTGAWFVAGDWVPSGAPGLGDDVLIPANKTCIVSGSVDAAAKSIEVGYGALLRVEDGLTLQIRTPLSHTFTALRINGIVKFTDASETGVLLVEMTGTGDHVFQILGDGQLIGDPAEMQTTSSPNQVDTVYVGAGSEALFLVTGTWDFPIDLDNDGKFYTGVGEVMIFSRADCDDMGISGDGVFDTNGGTMWFLNPEFEPGGVFDGTLRSTGVTGLMQLVRCGMIPGRFDFEAATIVARTGGTITLYDGMETDGATIIVESGSLLETDYDLGDRIILVDTQVTIDGGRFTSSLFADFTQVNLTVEGHGLFVLGDGLKAEDGDISICEDGWLFCLDSELILDDTDLSICDEGRLTTNDENLRLQDEVAILIQDDAALECARLYNTSPNDDIDLTVAGGTLECVSFTLNAATTLIISGGEFHVVGDTLRANLLASSTLTLSGGTLYLGGTFDGTSGSSVTVSGGTLDIRGDNPFEGEPDEDFRHKGTFSFTAGTIKVKDERDVLIGPDP